MSSDDIPVFHLKPSLIDLIKRGESAPVIHYLEKHPDEINQSDENGFYPIHHAIQEKHPELITILIEYGALIDECGPENVSTLMLAALHGMADSLPISKIDKSTLFQKDDSGNTLCHYLAFNGDVKQWVIFNIPEGEIIRQNHSRKSPIEFMIEEGNCALILELLNLKSVQKELHLKAEKFTNVCIRSGHRAILNILLSFGDQTREWWNSLIEQCCVLGKAECLREVLDWGKKRGIQIDSNRLKAVPSGLITPEISTILSYHL